MFYHYTAWMKVKSTVLVLTTTYPTFLAGDYTPGFVHELTKRLAQKELHMIVLTPRRPGTPRLEKQENITIVRYPYFFYSKWELLCDWAILPNLKKRFWLLVQVPFLLIMCLWYTAKVSRQYNVNCIHAHWLFINWCIAWLYKKLMNNRMRIICTAHGSDVHSLHWWCMQAIKKWTIQQCDEVTVVSQFLREQLLRTTHIDKNISVISMWVDTTLFNPNKYDVTVKKERWIAWKIILFVWRLAPEKWVADLIQAMLKIKEKRLDCTWVIVWDWPMRHELQRMVAQNELDDYVMFLWAVHNSELPKYYATADVFVIPSYKEWSPVVLLEALFSWSLCVGRDIPQIKEIQLRTQTNRLLLFWNEDELVDAIAQQLEAEKSPQVSLEMNQYTWDAVTLSFYKIIQWEE